jgi:hypothetical protein
LEDNNMKKQYLKPILNVDNAMPETLICVSVYGNEGTGLEPGGGNDGEARAPQADWNIWGDE